MDDRPLHRLEELRRRLRRHRADDAARHQKSEGVDRIARIWTEDHVARRGDRLRDIGETLLRAQRRDDLGLRIELHAEAPVVIGGLGLAQAIDAARRRVAVGTRLAQRFLQLLQHMRRRRQIGIAHAEVDDVGAGIPCGRLGAVDLFEDVRRQAADAVKFVHGSSAPATGQGRIARQYRFRIYSACPESALNQGFSAISGTGRPRPDLRLNTLLLARRCGRASELPRCREAYLPAASLAIAAACRSRAAISSAWILARCFGSIVVSSRSGGKSLTGK